MATPGRIITRFDGRPYQLASGRLARWTSSSQFELQFSTPGGFRVDYESEYPGEDNSSVEQSSGFVTMAQYATNSIFSGGTGYESVLITNAQRFQLVWWFAGWPWFFDNSIIYWSESGVFGPYYTSGHFAGTYNFDANSRKIYVDVPTRIDVIPILDA